MSSRFAGSKCFRAGGTVGHPAGRARPVGLPAAACPPLAGNAEAVAEGPAVGAARDDRVAAAGTLPRRGQLLRAGAFTASEASGADDAAASSHGTEFGSTSNPTESTKEHCAIDAGLS